MYWGWGGEVLHYLSCPGLSDFAKAYPAGPNVDNWDASNPFWPPL